MNHKYESSAGLALRFWQGLKEQYHMEGLSAPDAAACPYPHTSFAALHWRRGAAGGGERT